jgi:predicted DNA-binding transcriptional regulator YafY
MNSTRESTWTVVRRCLALLRRLQRGPATRDELIGAVLAAVDAEAYGGAEGKALWKRFEADKRHLREVFGLEIRYRRASGTYTLIDSREPLLDLSDRALEAIAFLQETFEPRTPNYKLVQELVNQLTRYLTPERRAEMARARVALAVQWGRRDRDMLAPGVDRALTKALISRRLIAFDYYSPSQPDGQPRRHTVEPWERYFDSARGHEYLYGYCRQTTSAAYGARDQHRYFHYRLGRIKNVSVLPGKLPATPPRVRTEPLVYRLAPEVVRRGELSDHPGIEIQSEETGEDGRVTVYAETDNVWWAVRTLLHYGATCEILGGPAARYEAERTVRALAARYGIGDTSE